MSYLAVNKSGSSISVYKQNQASSEKIGTIYPNEAFACFGDVMANGKVGVGILFLNSSGNLVYGGIPSQEQKYRRYVKDYPYGSVTISGKKYDTYKMRRVENIYTRNGNYWGQVAAGSLVVVDTWTLGDTHPNWCKITHVQKSNGTWQKVTGEGYDYGFLDYGLDHGSYNNNISMYGTWG